MFVNNFYSQRSNVCYNYQLVIKVLQFNIYTKISIAIGNFAGTTEQKTLSIAIGAYSGNKSQGAKSVAIGQNAGEVDQSDYSIALGYQAGQETQGPPRRLRQPLPRHR